MGLVEVKKAIVFVSVVFLVAGMVPFAVSTASDPGRGNSPSGTKALAGIPLVYQHKDTNMNCAAGCGAVAHGQTDVEGPDGFYGTADDCPHCSVYCAPASISMISQYRGRVGNVIQQDWIYDQGKNIASGEIPNDGILQTHGVGMKDTGWTEVQTAFTLSVGAAILVHSTAGANAIAGAQVIAYIDSGHPILWDDHNGWPANQSAAFPPVSVRTDMGHTKVVAGYDDSGTPGNTADDWYLIYDPWPEYNDNGTKYVGSKKGPGDTFDPYWIPSGFVLDPNDIHMADTYPNIPEFTALMVLPAAGLLAVVVVAAAWNKPK
jgi:hypothetical protein